MVHPLSAARHQEPERSFAWPPPKAGEPLNDHVLYHYFEAQAGKLMEEGKTSTNLLEQLDRKSCSCSLRASGRRRLAPETIVERVEPGVLVMGKFYHCPQCNKVHFETATGFVLSSSGMIATCLHVLTKGELRGLAAMTRDGQVFGVRKVLAADKLNDLAVLQLDGSGFTPLPVSTRAPAGARVMVLSHPDRRYYSVTTGNVSRYFVLRLRAGPATFMTVTADFAKGSSGAPVFNESGAVVGIVNNTRNIYYDTEDDKPADLQMVLKNCTPAAALLKLCNSR